MSAAPGRRRRWPGFPRSRILLAIALAFGVAYAVAASSGWLNGSAETRVPSSLRVDEAQLRRALRAAERTPGQAVRTVGRSGGDAAGAALARAIRYSREQARQARPQPLPPIIRRRLAPYFPENTLNDVRWTVAGRRISLGTVLAGWYYREGAVTLDDTVVFSDGKAAASLKLWAHELTHVRQFEELGVSDFARLYVENWVVLERQAGGNAARIVADVKTADARRATAVPVRAGDAP